MRGAECGAATGGRLEFRWREPRHTRPRPAAQGSWDAGGLQRGSELGLGVVKTRKRTAGGGHHWATTNVVVSLQSVRGARGRRDVASREEGRRQRGMQGPSTT
jgi:hypothetical protein